MNDEKRFRNRDSVSVQKRVVEHGVLHFRTVFQLSVGLDIAPIPIRVQGLQSLPTWRPWHKPAVAAAVRISIENRYEMLKRIMGSAGYEFGKKTAEVGGEIVALSIASSK